MSGIPGGLFINGERRRGGEPIALVNPATEERFAEVESAGPSEVDLAVGGAREAFESGWRDLSPGARASVLRRVAEGIRGRLEELAQLETRNIGKPIADARDEVGLGAAVFEYYAGAIGKFCGQTIPVSRGGLDFTLRQPLGVIAAIVPWNFPFPIACWKCAPALAAGNTVVLKPASQSPLTALRLGEIAAEAGLPPGALQVLPGPGAVTGNALATHRLVRKISFTGSTEVGKRIMRMAADDLKRVSLELGGKSPNIVFADADIEAAAVQSPMSVFANTGQDCCARSRVFVERPVYHRFLERFVEATRALRVGAPDDATVQIGPMVSGEQRGVAERFIAECREAGREIASGGSRPFDRGFYLAPTVVAGVEPEDRVWREEVFGPVVCIREFDDEEDMLREANATPYGLSGSIWTNDLKRAIRVSRALESGVISINSNSSVHVEAPFGGFKQSGLGRDLGMAAMEGYTELKNVYVGE